MTTYEFTFVVDNVDPHEDSFEDRFFDAGCDDATLMLIHGAVAVCFSREASSYHKAVLSAFENILTSGASLLRFEPDFLVNASEIAFRSGLSRAAVSLYENGERGENFPKPFARITTRSPLWDWVEVSRWLVNRGNLDEAEYRTAQISREVNFGVQKGSSFCAIRSNVENAISQPLQAA